MKHILFIVFVFIGYSVMAQVNLNQYKYIIVPKKLSEFREHNQYQSSTILKYEFGEKGFLAVYDDALPQDLLSNRCLGLVVSLEDDSSMFATKVVVVLKDCRGEEVFRTREGRNKIKEYSPAYKAAIREAMNSFKGVNYNYEEKRAADKPITLNFTNDIKKLEEGQVASKKSIGMAKNTDSAVRQVATTTEQSYKDRAPVTSEIRQVASPVKTKQADTGAIDVLYAQPIDNGYQLVDSTPKVRMKLLKSATMDVYIANGDGKSGMVFQKDGAWVFEYYDGEKLVQAELNIKF